MTTLWGRWWCELSDFCCRRCRRHFVGGDYCDDGGRPDDVEVDDDEIKHDTSDREHVGLCFVVVAVCVCKRNGAPLCWVGAEG